MIMIIDDDVSENGEDDGDNVDNINNYDDT
jgi:hypothetical protein